MNLFQIIFIVFLVLKLCNVIQWNWYAVTAPLWGSFCLTALWLLTVEIWYGFFASQETRVAREMARIKKRAGL